MEYFFTIFSKSTNDNELIKSDISLKLLVFNNIILTPFQKNKVQIITP